MVEDFAKKVKMDGMSNTDLKTLKDPTFANINLSAMQMADAVIKGSENILPELDKFIKSTDKPTVDYLSKDKCVEAYSNLYDELFVEDSVLAG